MKKTWKHVLTVVIPLAGLSALIGACASTTCNNDACYNRRVSSVDPYKEGDVAAWGSEKERDEQDERKDKVQYGRRLDGARSQ